MHAQRIAFVLVATSQVNWSSLMKVLVIGEPGSDHMGIQKRGKELAGSVILFVVGGEFLEQCPFAFSITIAQLLHIACAMP